MLQLFMCFYTTYIRCITKSNQNKLKLCKVILIFITNHFLLQFLCQGTPCLKSGRVKLARASPQGWGFVVSCKCRSEKQIKKFGGSTPIISFFLLQGNWGCLMSSFLPSIVRSLDCLLTKFRPQSLSSGESDMPPMHHDSTESADPLLGKCADK